LRFAGFALSRTLLQSPAGVVEAAAGMGVVAGVAMAEAVDFTAGAVGVGVSRGGRGGVVAGMAEAVGTMDLPAFAAEDMDLLVTP
jgi:hypothetical protein